MAQHSVDKSLFLRTDFNRQVEVRVCLADAMDRLERSKNIAAAARADAVRAAKDALIAILEARKAAAEEIIEVRQDLKKTRTELGLVRACAAKAGGAAAVIAESRGRELAAASAARAAESSARAKAKSLQESVSCKSFFRVDFFGFPSCCADSELITRRLGAGLEQELKSANEQRQAAEDEAAQLRAAASRACDSALGAPSGETSLVSRLEGIPSHLQAVVSEGAYLGALLALSVVTSHYDGIDDVNKGARSSERF